VIPAFDENGFLPPGVHPATHDETRARFSTSSEVRRVQMQSVEWMLDLARRAGVQRIVSNSSFATDTMEPIDVHCVLLLPPGKASDLAAEAELAQGVPFLEIQVVSQEDFDFLVNSFFALSRARIRKGMIEVIQWN
jgi:hypothetical protein